MNKKSIILSVLLSCLILGCTQKTEESTTDRTSTATTATTENPQPESDKKNPASLLVGNWKMTVDTTAETEELSEAEKEYFNQMMSEFEFIMKFTADGKVMTSGDDRVAEYRVEGNQIIVDEEPSKFTVTETELIIENDGETMKLARTDKDVSEVADLESQMEQMEATIRQKMEAEIEANIDPIKESEARTYVGAMNRGQQAYFLENSAFANTIEDLQLGLEAETKDYKYSITTKEAVSFQYAMAKSEDIKSFVGGVFLVSDGDTDYSTTNAGLCVADAPGMTQLGEPSVQDNEMVCPEGTTKVQ